MSELSQRDELQAMLESLCRESAERTALLYGTLMRVRQAQPLEREHWDHDIDLYYQWKDSRNPLWLERGVFNGLVLPGNGETLDLACGDGFNARNFYSLRSHHVVACDMDALAIEHARMCNAAENIDYRVANIVTEMPARKFDNIILDAAIEHLAKEEIETVLDLVKIRLNENGIFSGYTVIDAYRVAIHETYFTSKQDLYDLLKPHFTNVTVFETIYPSRHNLYWWTSEKANLPFSKDWGQCVRG